MTYTISVETPTMFLMKITGVAEEKVGKIVADYTTDRQYCVVTAEAESEAGK